MHSNLFSSEAIALLKIKQGYETIKTSSDLPVRLFIVVDALQQNAKRLWHKFLQSTIYQALQAEAISLVLFF